MIGSERYFGVLNKAAQVWQESIRRYYSRVCQDIRAMNELAYLNRRPIISYQSAIAHGYDVAGFPVFIAAPNFMRVHSKNCARAYKGQYNNQTDGKLATTEVEASFDHSLYVWR